MSDAGSYPLTTDALLDHPDLARLASAVDAPQAAVRARLNAIILDLVLVGFVSTLLVGALGSSVSPTTRAVTFIALQFSYFFVWELRSGQTIGKRIFHVRVTTSSGAPATWRAIAVRNVLRLVDALPFLNASGLISMIRTGPARRQRIGDVAAGTTIVLDPAGKPLRTPSWLLPAATILATLLSLAIIIPILEAPHPAPLGGSAAAGGLAGAGGRQSPVEGVWRASSQTISSIGYGNEADHTARWTIGRSCPPKGLCGLSLSYEAAGEGTVRAKLLAEPGGWVAVFPLLSFQCGETDGQPVYWQQHTIIALRFTDGGRAAEGEERDVSQTPRCGYGTSLKRWTASLAQ
ncbi:MAG TPA: RDD family protein [Solirubrobacteraceae bacterium]|nr:RDD family protein [Solirubrobacteraceae bacterium]HME02294.1 RDD family protein [Solirubrobacteraceae bacterium]